VSGKAINDRIAVRPRRARASGGTVALQALMLTLAGAIGTLSAAADNSADHRQQNPPSVSAKVAKPLKAALDAIQKEHWDEAVARLHEAQALGDRTPFDDYQIDEFLGFVAIKQNNYADAAAALERSFNSGFLPADRTTERNRNLAWLYYQLKNYPKAIEFGNRWIAGTAGHPLPDAYVIVGHSQYLLKNYRDALKMMQSAVEATQALGHVPQEAWLEVQLGCYVQLQDQPGMIAVLSMLVTAFPKDNYWTELFDLLQRQPDTDDRSRLNIYRLMFELGALKTADDYVEMARLALQLGVPGEAVTVLQQGIDRQVLSGKNKEQGAALLREAKTAARDDQETLPRSQKEAEAAKSGESDVQLGIAFLTYDEYDQALAALQRGIGKGGLKRPDEAQIALGRALLKLKRPDEARAAFEKVDGTAKLAAIAKLWASYTRQRTAPETPSSKT
jgi:tetratricopeptide (TPR) repeat protein